MKTRLLVKMIMAYKIMMMLAMKAMMIRARLGREVLGEGKDARTENIFLQLIYSHYFQINDLNKLRLYVNNIIGFHDIL